MLILWLMLAVTHITFMAVSVYYWFKIISPAVDIVKSAEQITPLLLDLRTQLLSAPALLTLVERINDNVDLAAIGAELIAKDLEAAHVRAESSQDDVAGRAADAAAVRTNGELPKD